MSNRTRVSPGLRWLWLVNGQRMGWGFNRVGNEDVIILVRGPIVEEKKAVLNGTQIRSGEQSWKR